MKSRLASFFFAGLLAFSSALQVSPVQADVRNDIDAKVRNTVAEPEESAQPVPEGTASSSPGASAGAEASATPSVEPSASASASPSASPSSEPSASASASSSASPSSEPSASPEASSEPQAGASASASASPSVPLIQRAARADTASATPEAVSANDHLVHDFDAQVFYGGTNQDDGKYVWSARSHAAGHRFSYRVSFGLGDEESGDDMVFAPGTIRITVPVTVLKDRNGNPADKYEMSVPSMAEVKESEESGTPLDNDISFAYEEQVDSDNNRVIVITNIRDVYPGFEGFIEMSYLTTEETFAYKDMEQQGAFTAAITAMDPSTVTDTDNPDGTWTTPQTKQVDGVYIDTQVALQGMSQRAPAQYDKWQATWGDAPEDLNTDDYSYFVYELDSVIGDNSQEYAMSIDDEITSLIVTKDNGATVQEIEPGPDTGFAAAWFDAKGAYKIGQPSDLDGTGNPNGKYDKESGHRYDYVVLAFKKTLITEANKLEITTRTTATVHPRDDDADGSQATSQTFERRFVWNKPVFHGYGGGFGGWVRADGFYRYQAGRDEWPREYFTELGNHASNYSGYNLNDLVKEDQPVSGLDYAIWTEGYVGQWSIDRNATNPGEADYFKEPVRYEMTDNQFYLSDENDGVSQDKKDRLTSSKDYQIDSLRFNVYAYDAVYDKNRAEFINSGKVTYGDDEALTFYVQVGSTDTEFQKAAVYSLKANKFIYPDTNDTNYVKGVDASVSGGPEIDFKDNVVGYCVETKNAHYYTRIGVVPSVTLKPSERVRGYNTSANNPTESFALNNRTVTTIYDYKDKDGNTLEKGSDGEYQHAVWGPAVAQDADFIRMVEKVGSLTKDIVASTNLQKKKEYRVTWKIHADESYIYGQNEKGYAEQNGGTFYDLLPIGAVLDPDSIILESNEGELPASSYSLATVSTNYKDTGRTFVKITVYDPADWYDLYYDTVHTYESIRDYGNEAYNSVAYQTGNDSIEGFYQDPANPKMDSKLRSYFDRYLSDEKNKNEEKKDAEMTLLYGAVGVANPNDDSHFLFRGRDGDIEAITAAASGLTKRILSSRSNRYDTTAIVDNNSEYSYRLRFQNSYSSSSENIILYDDLENYQKDGRGSDWKGTLKAIDFSALPKDKSGKDLIRPVVYYSKDNQNFDGKTAPDLSAWTKLEPGKDGAIPENLQKEIRAIAIDLSKAADGTAYTLGKGEAVSVNLIMTAPAGATSKSGYPQTYNGVLISYDRITDSSRRHQVSMEGCTVGQLVISRDVNIKKLSNRDHTPIRGIQFRLYGTSDYGTAVDKIQSTDRNGALTFTKVEKGTSYTLMEYGSNPEWLDDHTAYTVKINDDGELWITNPKATEEKKTLEYARAKNETDHPFWFEIENTPRIHGDLSFYKARQTTKDNDALIGIPDTTFELAGTSDYGNDIVKTAVSDKNGLVKIQNIEKGTYTLREIKANVDYILNEDKYQVVVNDAGTVTLYKPVRDQADPYELADNIGGQPVIFNTPAYWDVSFLKVDKDLPTRTLEGAEFTVTGASLKQPVTVSSNANGRVTFHHLKAGSYVLKETKAPAGLNGEGKKPEAGKEAEGVLNYTADPSEYLLTINNDDGTFTITKDGKGTLSKNTNGDYLFPNERPLDGQITIIKKWDDASNNDDRPTPVIHLETSENQEKYTGARVVVEWLNDYASARPSAEDGVTVTIVDGDGKEVVSSSKATSTSGNLWFYNFPDQELNSAQTYYVYETQPVSIVDNGKYTGSAVGAENKIQLVHGKATISNTYKETYDFSYTGDVQTFTASHPGYYRLEVWGASGGFDGVSTDRTDYDTYVNNHWDRPGLGGYSYGSYYMNKGETVYVIVGEQGHDHTLGGTNPSYNGGGRTTAWSGVRGDSSGGGMTHISTLENVADASSNSDWDPDGTIIVAGGGGGIDNYGNQDEGARGGAGGGTTGGNAWASHKEIPKTGGGTNGKYQKQGVGENYTGGASDCGGGGGGWYGGASSWNHDGGAGGGSGYVSDVLKNAKTIAGSEEVPNPNGGKEIGHFGNGYARITFISSDSPTVSDNTAAGSTQTASNTSTYETTADGWTKVDDNTWKYVMPVFNDTATYKYWETYAQEDADAASKYTSDAPSAADEKFVINGSENKTLVVTNTAKNKYGSITVSKKVVDTNGNELTTSTQDFTFTLTLKNGDSPLTGTQVIGDQVFTNGSVTFTLHEGESKRFDNVPIGMNYEVSETSNKNYTTTSVDSGKGLVSGDSSVEFTNTYTLAPKSRTEVTLEKKAEGSVAGSEKDAYPFHAHLTGLDANLEFGVVIGSDDTDTTVQNYMSNAQGEADVTLSLKSGQKAVFKNIPVGATYRFVEDAGQWTARFKAANATADGTIARTSGENTSENQELATETETVEEGEKTTVTFINTLAFTQQLTVKKTVTHGEGEKPADHPNEKFEVTVTFTGLKPGARIDTDSVGILTADDTGMAVKTFNMKDQQSVVFRNVPVSAKYQVKETGNDYIGSYRIYYGKDQTPIVSGQNDAANKDLNTTEKTMVKDQDPTVELISGTRWVKVAFRKEAEDGTKLHGANFTLYKGTGDSRAEYNKMSLGEKTLTLASGTYELVETKAPRGYLITDDTATITFNVNEKGVELVDDKPGKMVSIEKEDGKDPVIVIKNKAGTRLPSTGGMDVRILLAAAVAMIGTALFGFWKLKKEEKN